MTIEECKVGQKVIWLPGFNNGEQSGGAGYEEGKIFTIRAVDFSFVYPEELYQNKYDYGVYPRAFKLYNPQYTIW